MSSPTRRSTPSCSRRRCRRTSRLRRAALEAGKHVFVEKPLAASTSECLELIELADERGLVLMPGHTFLYSPPVSRSAT